MADLLDAAEDDARGGRVAKRSNHMAVSNIEWKDVATVVEPAVAKCLNPGLREVAEEDLTEEDRTFFVVRKRPEGNSGVFVCSKPVSNKVSMRGFTDSGPLTRVSKCLRAGLGQNLRQNRGNRQNYRVFSRYTRGVSGLPAKYPGICRLGLFWDQTSLRLGSEPGKFDGFPGN